MKKIFYLLPVLAFTFFVAACNQGGEHAEASHDDGHEHASADAADTSLTLNNGAKWVVDSTTADNYINLQTTTNMFAVDPYPSLANYQVYGNDMGTAINKLMKECRMKGADHDALHHWLEPIIRQTKELKNVSDTVEARRLFDSVHTRVDAYNQYFAEVQ